MKRGRGVKGRQGMGEVKGRQGMKRSRGGNGEEGHEEEQGGG
jgi:hypothetical protein